MQEALRGAADSPGYPLTVGRAETRQACIDWLGRRHGVTGLTLGAVLPVIGSKELIASMPGHLGIGAGDLVAYPELASTRRTRWARCWPVRGRSRATR